MARCAFLTLALWLLTMSVNAHEVRPAYLQITPLSEAGQDPVYQVLWKQPIVNNARLPIDPIFDEACSVADQVPPEVTSTALIHQWLVSCDLAQTKIHISGLSLTLTDVMVQYTRDGESQHFILRPENPTLDLSSDVPPTFAYLILGVEHLLLGIDHVLFVIGLVLFIREPWMLLKTITAFTLAHSITLALSVLGWVRLDQGPVEAVIALSIVFLARELAMDEKFRSRLTQAVPWIMAFVFGLLHGLGFAGALADIGLPEDALWLSLLLFNVGIEVGQLIVIAIMVGLGWLFMRRFELKNITRWGAYGMGCLAMFWTIDRTLILL